MKALKGSRVVCCVTRIGVCLIGGGLWIIACYQWLNDVCVMVFCYFRSVVKTD